MLETSGRGKGQTGAERGGQEALEVVGDILAELQLQALAPGTESGFFEPFELGVAYSAWPAYRRQVVGE
jgi:hypothetical protein